MNEEFPLVDSSLTLEACMKKLNNKQEACIVLSKGDVHSILSYEELLKAFLKRNKKDMKLEEIKSNKNFVVVNPETDVYEIIKIIRKGKNFVVVKDKNIVGLITKKEIAEINQMLFDEACLKQTKL